MNHLVSFFLKGNEEVTGSRTHYDSGSASVFSDDQTPVMENTTSSQAQVIAQYQEQVKVEKAGKRKLYHALVKLAGELKRVKAASGPLQEQADYANQNWYQGGLWRSPELLPGIEQQSSAQMLASQPTRPRQAVSLSDLFFNLVIVTAFTRVGVAITNAGTVTVEAILYFAVFWIIWSKEAEFSTRFDTTDLSAKLLTLLNCFVVLFASLSVSSPMSDSGATRIMAMAAFCSMLHCGLMARVLSRHKDAMPSTLEDHVRSYALFHTVMNFIECTTWIFGMAFMPLNYRWIIFTVGVLLGLRIPRAFLANDFHAANTKRGVLFILLLGFMLQGVVIVATGFFEYSTPNFEQYSFIGTSCLLLFCIKLLYVDDSNVLASDHALLISRTAAFFFSLGQFALLFSTTLMGSGLNLLTHSYLAAAAALPGPAKSLVCGGFAAVLLSTAFIKSMHLKRVPRANPQKAWFIGAYIIQLVATVAVSAVCLVMSNGQGGYLQVMMQNDMQLMWTLSLFAVFLVALSFLDEGLELALQGAGGETGVDYLVHPFGFWCCCMTPEMEEQSYLVGPSTTSRRPSETGRLGLSELSPLLGESIANMRMSFSVSGSNADLMNTQY
eukprot:Nitzschia sp. Nitz4//scaffold255_size41878//19653//21754//NITZ4_007404-RA/size41878-augustus-gene-0.43-mRNA-1//-1//CDS//3329544368//7830//frame0